MLLSKNIIRICMLAGRHQSVTTPVAGRTPVPPNTHLSTSKYSPNLDEEREGNVGDGDDIDNIIIMMITM